MIDWHCHVLPAMDDGSRDLEESIAMLDALKHQGV
jgi:protein-tyrosine phosphatase